MKKQDESQQFGSLMNNEEEVVGNTTSNLLIAAIGSGRSLFQIWDSHNNEAVHSFDFDEIPNDDNKRGMVMGIDAFHCKARNGMVAVIVSESGFIDVYDVRASKILFSKRFGDNEALTCMALNGKRTRGICAGANHMLYGFSIKYDVGNR